MQNLFSRKIMLKGTVVVISHYSQYIEWYVRFITVPFKSLFYQECVYYLLFTMYIIFYKVTRKFLHMEKEEFV